MEKWPIGVFASVDAGLGVKLDRWAEGTGELEVCFDPTISIEETMIVKPSGA